MTANINTTFECDGCHEVAKATAYGTSPDGWQDVRVGHRIATRHACSKGCAAKVLRQLADELDPPAMLEAPKVSPALRTMGGPYR